MMTSVANHVRNNFEGMLVFGDVHGNVESMARAYSYARKHNYFFMSLGDLVDRGDKPFETVTLMNSTMKLGHAGFTVGNHDDKFNRHSKGNKVSFSRDAKKTLEDVGEARMADFLRMYNEVVEHPTLSAHYHTFGDFTVVHAACHPSMWEGAKEGSTGKSARSRFLVGETNGETMDDGYPVRLYNWIEEVPMGKTVMVGHDKMPVHGVNITEPMVVRNSNGGKVVFLDTGCGKGGFLSGAVVLPKGNTFVVDRFEEFR